jgi:hypothetical protein
LQGCKATVLASLCSFFSDADRLLNNPVMTSDDSSEADRNELDKLRQTEGTVILHICFAVKQDQVTFGEN